MIESLFTSPAALGLSAGLVVTVALGFLCGPFLEKSVTIEFQTSSKTSGMQKRMQGERN